MAIGRVKFFDQKTGKGMIASEGKPDVFFLAGDVIMTALTKGQRIRFNVVTGKDGPRAVRVIDDEKARKLVGQVMALAADPNQFHRSIQTACDLNKEGLRMWKQFIAAAFGTPVEQLENLLSSVSDRVRLTVSPEKYTQGFFTKVWAVNIWFGGHDPNFLSKRELGQANTAFEEAVELADRFARWLLSQAEPFYNQAGYRIRETTVEKQLSLESVKDAFFTVYHGPKTKYVGFEFPTKDSLSRTGLLEEEWPRQVVEAWERALHLEAAAGERQKKLAALAARDAQKTGEALNIVTPLAFLQALEEVLARHQSK